MKKNQIKPIAPEILDFLKSDNSQDVLLGLKLLEKKHSLKYLKDNYCLKVNVLLSVGYRLLIDVHKGVLNLSGVIDFIVFDRFCIFVEVHGLMISSHKEFEESVMLRSRFNRTYIVSGESKISDSVLQTIRIIKYEDLGI